LNSELFDYYFAYDDIFVIPIEHLSSVGLSRAFENAVLDRGLFTRESTEMFNQAFSTYWTRALGLHEKAPRFWFPPRVQHVCIVTKPHCIRPYYLPFNNNSWALHASDFDPSFSTLEFATYQFFHVERMALLQEIGPASLAANISYFLTLSPKQLRDFSLGCRKTSRPDAKGFRTLAEAMSWIQKLYHEQIKRPTRALPRARVMRETGLILPSNLVNKMEHLLQSWLHCASNVIQQYRKTYTRLSVQKTKISTWLSEIQPPLLVTGNKGKILWDPDAPEDTAALQASLTELTAQGEERILQDLDIIGFHSRRFLESLRFPHELANPAPDLSEAGLSYVHGKRKLVAYNIGPGEYENRLWESSPPYERLMLAARTIHEWTHLAAESGWIRIPPATESEWKALTEELAELFDEMYAVAPTGVRNQTARDLTALEEESGRLGQAVLKRMLHRSEDFLCNLLAQRFLRPDEMDTYVRNNVYSHWKDDTQGGAYVQLGRQAYEFQYLSLSRIEDPMGWFLKSTWFTERFIQPGIISESLFDRLITKVTLICACYQIDETKFDFSALPQSDGSPSAHHSL
tara:strand:- start:3024 stop:4745 length:1722 start_codon:yes stop_codon:yes gene_type:complete